MTLKNILDGWIVKMAKLQNLQKTSNICNRSANDLDYTRRQIILLKQMKQLIDVPDSI